MSYFEQPTITISPPELIDETHYFHDKEQIIDNDLMIKKQWTLQDENDPPINISNKLNYHHPLAKELIDQKVHSAPILQRLLPPPPSILLKNPVNKSSPSIPKHISIADDEERRPSVITFVTEFYDALEDIGDDEKIVIHDERPIHRDTKRPSLMSRISSAYTNKTAAITVDRIDLDECQYLHEGIILCAMVSKRKQQLETQQKYHHQTEFHKRPLKWKEYRAVITQSGYLQLYNVCHCNNKNSMLHMCLHFRHNEKPQYTIDLHPSVNNKLFQKSFLVNHRNSRHEYKLSLMSPIDFSWCLQSAHTIFYFQSHSVNVSQHWYRSLYTALPVKSKLALPKNVDLVIPALSTCIRLPLTELITEEDENVDLRKVRDSALVLLHRNGSRPDQWSKRTVGLCWKLLDTSSPVESLDWALKPSDDEHHPAYLIEPRLIEKTHELQLRYCEDETKEDGEDTLAPTSIQGYLIDQSSSSTIANKLHAPFYAKTMDQFIFLYENKLQFTPTAPKNNSLCCFSLKKTVNKTSPNSIVESSPPRAAVGIIDLAKITDISEESGDEQREDHSLLHLNDYSFEIMDQPIHDWSTRLGAIQKHYANSSNCKNNNNTILQCNDVYIKVGKGKYSAFQRRFCILTNTGDLCVFKSPKHAPYKKMDFSIPIKEDAYVYSGEECCDYIRRLPLQWSSRIFDNGLVVQKTDKPNQCCFVIHAKNQDYVFLMRTREEKEPWVQSICSYL